MAGTRDSGWGRIDGAAKRRFVAALKRGASTDEAARAGGFWLGSFYRARKRDAGFDQAWAEAIRARRRFNAERREIFLSHLARSCNVLEAARIAGVHPATVYRHRAGDRGFAADFAKALDEGYARLEAELGRARAEAERRLREGPPPVVMAAVPVATDFDTAMKLLKRWERRDGSIGPRTVAHGRQRRASFDDAIEALAKRLKALDIPIADPAAPGKAE